MNENQYRFGQLTGLLDIHGTPIKGGDIIGELVMLDGQQVQSAFPVVWWNEMAAFAVDLSYNKDRSYLSLLAEEYFGHSIIGNVRDNPNLLVMNNTFQDDTEL